MHSHHLNSIFTALSPFPFDHEIAFQSPSDFAQNNLFYLHFIHELDVIFPFALECTSFDGYLMIYTKEGNSLLTYNEATYRLNPHTLTFIHCNTSFKLELAQSTCWKADLLMLNGLSMASYYQTITSNNQYLFEPSPALNVSLLIRKLYELFNSSNRTNEFVISKLITDLLTNLILTKDITESSLPAIPKYLIQIKNYMDLNYSIHINLDELAKLYHVSKYKIIRDFQMHYHSSPINYLIDQRMKEAKKLLLETDDPVCEIACKVGVDNMNHFTNLFKKNTGLTPSCYRRKCQIDLYDYT